MEISDLGEEKELAVACGILDVGTYCVILKVGRNIHKWETLYQCCVGDYSQKDSTKRSASFLENDNLASGNSVIPKASRIAGSWKRLSMFIEHLFQLPENSNSNSRTVLQDITALSRAGRSIVIPLPYKQLAFPTVLVLNAE